MLTAIGLKLQPVSICFSFLLFISLPWGPSSVWVFSEGTITGIDDLRSIFMIFLYDILPLISTFHQRINRLSKLSNLSKMVTELRWT